MKKLLTNNIGLKLISVLIAALTWLIVVNIDDPVGTKTLTVPVQMVNTDMITANGKTYEILNQTDSVRVTVKAKRSIIEEITSDHIEAIADFSRLYYQGIPIELKLLKFKTEAEIQDSDPTVLQISEEEVGSNKFSVAVNIEGSPMEGYVIDSEATRANVEPDHISISGAESVMDKISKVTADINVTGFSEDKTVTCKLKLYDDYGTEIDPVTSNLELTESEVEITVSVLQTKSVPIEFTPAGNLESGYTLTDITSEPSTITIAGKKSKLKEIDKIEIPGDVLDISELTSTTEVVVDITPYLVEGIQLMDEADGNVLVKVGVEEWGSKSIELPVLSISINNKPDDLEVVYPDTNDLIVVCRGDSELLESLTVSEIAASIDLKKYNKKGSYDVQVHLELPSGVNVSETIKVKIKLEEKQE